MTSATVRPLSRNVVLVFLCLSLLTAAAMAQQYGATATSPVSIAPTNYVNMYDLYSAQYDDGTPTFITTDSLLHTTHILFDYTLRAVELNSLRADLLALCKATTTTLSTTAANQATTRSMNPPPYGYDRAAEVTGVAWKLLDPQAQLSPLISSTVNKEVALITAATGPATSPVLGITEDYTQYIPRGHYTRNEQFKSYFRAMMWLGRAGFQLNGEKSLGVPLTQDECRRNAWAGYALSAAVYGNPTTTAPAGSPRDLWQKIHTTTGYLIGAADDLTPQEYVPLWTKVMGTGTIGAWNADAQAKTDQFITEAIKLRTPHILGSIMSNQQTAPPVSLRLLGQSATPDSEWFQSLVNNAIPGRNMPTGLDIMAVLGSPTAEQLLQNKGEFTNPVYGQAYSAELAALQQEVNALPPDSWQKTAYLRWLMTLSDLVTDALPNYNGTATPAYPSWWHDPVWETVMLNAGLGSWAELRHDTILYAKQSYSDVYSAHESLGISQVYVEPTPLVYEDLQSLITAVEQGLQQQKLFPQQMTDNYSQFLSLLSTADSASRSELGIPAPAVAQPAVQLTNIGSLLQSIQTLPEPLNSQITGDEDNMMALVADVHTDPNSGQVLEVGVGDVYSVTVPVQINGETVSVTGPIFSYYEFPQPMANRLTDGTWQGMLTGNTAPAPFILTTTGMATVTAPGTQYPTASPTFIQPGTSTYPTYPQVPTTTPGTTTYPYTYPQYPFTPGTTTYPYPYPYPSITPTTSVTPSTQTGAPTVVSPTGNTLDGIPILAANQSPSTATGPVWVPVGSLNTSAVSGLLGTSAMGVYGPGTTPSSTYMLVFPSQQNTTSPAATGTWQYEPGVGYVNSATGQVLPLPTYPTYPMQNGQYPPYPVTTNPQYPYPYPVTPGSTYPYPQTTPQTNPQPAAPMVNGTTPPGSLYQDPTTGQWYYMIPVSATGGTTAAPMGGQN